MPKMAQSGIVLMPQNGVILRSQNGEFKVQGSKIKENKRSRKIYK
jgi:hypothetical protein